MGMGCYDTDIRVMMMMMMMMMTMMMMMMMKYLTKYFLRFSVTQWLK